LWSHARRYLGLSYDPAFEETVSADQGHGGGVACTAKVDTLKDEEEGPHTLLMGELKFKMY
jgi:hypothetical protein